ncbi:MAG: spore coat protein [Clostridiales bacterium]|nr:spore coat protein [Clostridiales bacterium]MCF8022219.1 spore coat protein [Clostridiales bacterium]
MAASYGAHEVMELNETLSNTINTINNFQLYRSYTKDPQLQSILDNHIHFMTQEYNDLVQAANQSSITEAMPYQMTKNTTPVYGIDNPSQQTPNTSVNQMEDCDIASSILQWHKSSAKHKMSAALEFANPELRGLVQQSSNNCAEQAYEVWQYMNQRGFYQLPTMNDMTTRSVMNNFYGTTHM